MTDRKRSGVLRRYFALWLGKSVRACMKLAGKRATQLPGKLCLKVCPDFLSFVDKPKRRIAITGTNGKTTTTNRVASMCEANGWRVACNRYGSNLEMGICSAILEYTGWTNKTKADCFVLEVDEMGSPKSLPYLDIQYLVVTNLFRDQYERIAYVDSLVRRINAAITPNTVLVLNADDPYQSFLGTKANKRLYYGPNPDDFEPSELIYRRGEKIDWIPEIEEFTEVPAIHCASCGHQLTRDQIVYASIGRYHCEHCGYESPRADYELRHEADGFHLRGEGADVPVRAELSAVFERYNAAAAVTAALLLGISPSLVEEFCASKKWVSVRVQEERIGKRRVTRLLNKGSTTVPTDAAIRYAAQSGPSTLFFIDTNRDEELIGVYNMAWVHDINYGLLNSPGIVNVVMVASRWRDYRMAMEIAGVDMTKVRFFETPEEIGNLSELLIGEHVVICYELYTLSIEVSERIVAEIKAEGE